MRYVITALSIMLITHTYLSKTSSPYIFIVGEQMKEVQMRSYGIFKPDITNHGSNKAISLEYDVMLFIKSGHVIVFYYINNQFIQIEVIQWEARESAADFLRKDFIDPKANTKYPIAYHVIKIGNSARIKKMYTITELRNEQG